MGQPTKIYIGVGLLALALGLGTTLFQQGGYLYIRAFSQPASITAGSQVKRGIDEFTQREAVCLEQRRQMETSCANNTDEKITEICGAGDLELLYLECMEAE